MMTAAVPTGFSSSGAMTLLQTMQAISSDNDRFLTEKMSSVSAHVAAKLSAGTLFSILGAVAASRGQMVSIVAGQAEQEGQATGVPDDLILQFGATATATVRTAGAQVSKDTAAGHVTALVSVTTADVHIDKRQAIDPSSTASYLQRYVEDYVSNNSLSSKDISDTLYSGGSIGDASIPGDRSFKDVIKEMYSWAESDSAMASNVASWLADGRPTSSMLHFDGQSDDQVMDFISGLNKSVERLDTEASALTTAFNRHTLTFEKAPEVQGLDYSETIRAYAVGGGGGMGGSVTMNNDFLMQDADGKQHTMLRIGNVALYATW